MSKPFIGSSLIRQIITFLAALTLSLIVGCASNSSGQVDGAFVALDTVKDSHMFEEVLSEEQIKESILEGAKNAGWKIEDSDEGLIIAGTKIRVHTIQVYVFYSDFKYEVQYKSSIGMKMYCSKRDRDKRKNQKLSGLEDCPYSQAPQYIHRNYDTWITTLISEIEKSRLAKL